MKNNYLIVGLGNPGEKYKNTRHNIGFLVVEEILNRFEIIKKEYSNFFLSERFFINKEKRVKAYLMQPLTFMNNSGIAVKNFFDNYNSVELIVVHDDIDLKTGKIRVKKKSGHGGHNGIKSIINEIKSNDFYRVKIGIGRPENKEDIPQYVLSDFSKKELPIIQKSIKKSLEIILDLMFNKIKKGGS